MIIIDEEKIFNAIEIQKPKSVAVNGPEGLLSKIQNVADNITKRYNIPAYIIADTCWGSCDLNTHAADMLGVDILFNIGHTISFDQLGKVIMINAYDDITFDKAAEKCIRELERKNYKTISVVTDSQHLNQLSLIKELFKGKGFNVIVGKGKGQLTEGQIFGCEFYPAFKSKDSVDVFVFLGQSRFHAAGLALSTQKPTYMLDPYFNECIYINDFAEKLKKKAILSVYKALDARRIGIIIGLKEGQFAQIKALELRKIFEKSGRDTQLIAMTEITNERLQNFKNLDAFIQVACPRISIDNHFDKPVLSVPQAFELINLIKKEEPHQFLMLPHWL